MGISMTETDSNKYQLTHSPNREIVDYLPETTCKIEKSQADAIAKAWVRARGVRRLAADRWFELFCCCCIFICIFIVAKHARDARATRYTYQRPRHARAIAAAEEQNDEHKPIARASRSASRMQHEERFADTVSGESLQSPHAHASVQTSSVASSRRSMCRRPSWLVSLCVAWATNNDLNLDCRAIDITRVRTSMHDVRKINESM